MTDTPTDRNAPSDNEVVETAAEAAEGVVFVNYQSSDITDLDVTVTFESGVLEVDVYLNVPDDIEPSEAGDDEAVVEQAATAAREAVDELFDE